MQGRQRLCTKQKGGGADEVGKITDVATTGDEVLKGFGAASIPEE